jgi:hypothetical protein
MTPTSPHVIGVCFATRFGGGGRVGATGGALHATKTTSANRTR